VVEETLQRVPVREARSIQEVLEIDAFSRSIAREVVGKKAQSFEERGPLPVSDTGGGGVLTR
jgi:hypothetical protein